MYKTLYQFPMGKVKVLQQALSETLHSYQFPMGKVKPSGKTGAVYPRIGYVSIPNGKGKDVIVDTILAYLEN